MTFNGFKAEHTGGDHTQRDRPRQDVTYLGQVQDGWLLVVADGCSMGAASEVGAHLCTTWIGRWFDRLSVEHDDAVELGEALARGCQSFLGSTLDALDLTGKRRESDIGRFGLFTLLVAHVGGAKTRVWASGDGLVAFNDEVIHLMPDAGNRPRYLGYGLLPAHRRPSNPSLEVQLERPTAELTSLFLATDGVEAFPEVDGPLWQAWAHKLSRTHNPASLQRMVRMAAKQHRPSDDVGIAAVVRHAPATPSAELENLK